MHSRISLWGGVPLLWLSGINFFYNWEDKLSLAHPTLWSVGWTSLGPPRHHRWLKLIKEFRLIFQPTVVHSKDAFYTWRLSPLTIATSCSFRVVTIYCRPWANVFLPQLLRNRMALKSLNLSSHRGHLLNIQRSWCNSELAKNTKHSIPKHQQIPPRTHHPYNHSLHWCLPHYLYPSLYIVPPLEYALHVKPLFSRPWL